MTTQHSGERRVDTEATRRQFLFAREQVCAHLSAAEWPAAEQSRLRSARALARSEGAGARSTAPSSRA
jgi:hypothetical protein